MWPHAAPVPREGFADPHWHIHAGPTSPVAPALQAVCTGCPQQQGAGPVARKVLRAPLWHSGWRMLRTSRWFTVFLASVTALTSLSIDMSLPAVPAIERDFTVPTGHGSLSLSIFLAGYALTPLLGGPLADRFGRRAVLLASLALFTAASLACAAAPGFPAILGARLLQGCASGVAVALPLAIVRDLFEGHAARGRIAEVTTINGLTPLVAPILGAWVMLLGSWRLIFIAQGLFAVSVSAVVLLGFQESLAPARRQPLHPAHLLRNYVTIFTDAHFLPYALIYGLTFACIFSFIASSPLILMQRMHVARAAYTLLFALTVTGTILGALTSSLLSRRGLAPTRVIAGGLALMTVASAVAVTLQAAGLHRAGALLPPVAVALFCFGLTAPAVTLQALETLPQLAGSGSGAIRSLQMIVGSAVSSLLAFLCALPAVEPAVAATAAMALCALASLGLFLGTALGARRRSRTGASGVHSPAS